MSDDWVAVRDSTVVNDFAGWLLVLDCLDEDPEGRDPTEVQMLRANAQSVLGDLVRDMKPIPGTLLDILAECKQWLDRWAELLSEQADRP